MEAEISTRSRPAVVYDAIVLPAGRCRRASARSERGAAVEFVKDSIVIARRCSCSAGRARDPRQGRYPGSLPAAARRRVIVGAGNDSALDAFIGAIAAIAFTRAKPTPLRV